MALNPEKMERVLLKNKITERNLLFSNDKIFSEDNKVLDAEYIMKDGALRIKWYNGVIHYYLKCVDYYQMHYFDNFDLEYYKKQINSVKITDWISGMDHWIFKGRLKNKQYFEKSNIVIGGKKLEVYVNYSHMNVVDSVNNKKYIFTIQDGLYKINLNSFKIVNGKIIYENNNNNIVKYIKKENVYEEVGNDIYDKINDIIKNNERIIVFYNKNNIEFVTEKIELFKFFEKSYLKVVLNIDNIFNYDEEYNLLTLPYVYKNKIFIKSNILIYYEDDLLYDEISKYTHKKLFGINYDGEKNYNIFNKEINNIVLNNEHVIYYDVRLYNFLNKIDCARNYYYINSTLDNIKKTDLLKNILEDIM